MGNNESKQQGDSPQQWQYYGNHNGIDLYKRTDGLILEKRKVTLDHRFDPATQKKIYKMRQNNQHGFVKVYEVVGVQEKKKQSQFCQCSPTTTMIVYSERIQNRLSDLPQLSFPESLNILYAAALGFHRLYEEFVPFHINGELIGINSEGQVRVWLNQNWALNHPSHQISYHRAVTESDLPIELRNENQMINNLLQIMEEKTENGRFPQPFLQEVYENSGSWRKLKRYLAGLVEGKEQQPQKREAVTQGGSRINQVTNHHPQDVRYDDLRHDNRLNGGPVQHVQSTYVPQEQPKTSPVFGEKIKGSIILPPGYVPPAEPRTYSKPTVSFGNRPAHAPPVHFQHAPPPQTSYSVESRPVMEHRAPLPEQPHSFPTTTSSAYPRFRLVNDGIPAVNHSVEPLPPKETATSFQGRDPQLEEIRRMLRQDISEMSSHHAEYRVK